MWADLDAFWLRMFVRIVAYTLPDNALSHRVKSPESLGSRQPSDEALSIPWTSSQGEESELMHASPERCHWDDASLPQDEPCEAENPPEGALSTSHVSSGAGEKAPVLEEVPPEELGHSLASEPEAKPSLANLPAELILMITKDLPAGALIFLRPVCQNTRSMIPADSADPSKLRENERRIYQLAVWNGKCYRAVHQERAGRLPDSRLPCSICRDVPPAEGIRGSGIEQSARRETL
jgi:hypothetical protein